MDLTGTMAVVENVSNTGNAATEEEIAGADIMDGGRLKGLQV